MTHRLDRTGSAASARSLQWLAVLGLAALVVVVALGACSGGRNSDGGGEDHREGFGSLSDLIAQSDLVVRATVADVGPVVALKKRRLWSLSTIV